MKVRRQYHSIISVGLGSSLNEWWQRLCCYAQKLLIHQLFWLRPNVIWKLCIMTDAHEINVSQLLITVAYKSNIAIAKNRPQRLWELAYTSMCPTVLQYASPICYPYLQHNADSLVYTNQQMQSSKVYYKDFHLQSNVTAMMHSWLATIQWEPLAASRTKARANFMYLTVINN